VEGAGNTTGGGEGVYAFQSGGREINPGRRGFGVPGIALRELELAGFRGDGAEKQGLDSPGESISPLQSRSGHCSLERFQGSSAVEKDEGNCF